jgi:hypothetical protein
MGLELNVEGKSKDLKQREVCLSVRDLSKNRKMIFGHDIGSLTSANEKESYYNERALIMAEKKDTVLLNRPTDKNYLNYIKSLDLGPSEVIVLNSTTIYEGIKNIEIKKADATYSPFISKTKDKEVQEKVATHYIGNPEEITMKYYDKASFKDVCTELKIETAPGGIFEKTGDLIKDRNQLRALVNDGLSRTEEVILRHTTGEGGMSILFANKDNMEIVMDKILADSGKYLVESKLEVENSPCVIGLIDKDGPTLVAVSSQILKDGKAYSGSTIDYEAAVDKKIYDPFMKLGKKMHEDGYRGPFGIDFIETTDGRKMPCECNARINGSFYPHELRQSLSRKGIEFNTVYAIVSDDLKFKSFTELMRNDKASNMLYQGGKESGIVPFNVSSMDDGKMYFVVLSNSHEEAKKISREFKNLLRKP